jgi:hypothetical protein
VLVGPNTVGKTSVMEAIERVVAAGTPSATWMAHELNLCGVRSAAATPSGFDWSKTEASCKCIFDVRMKRSGARWKETSAGNVINLRATALGHRWDEAMEWFHFAACKDVRRAT